MAARPQTLSASCVLARFALVGPPSAFDGSLLAAIIRNLFTSSPDNVPKGSEFFQFQTLAPSARCTELGNLA